MPESPIRKLVPLAVAAKKQGRQIYHLNIGQPDITTPKEFWTNINQENVNIVAYTNSEGIYKYRQKLTKYYSKFDIEVEAEDILITVGASEAISFAFLTCLNPGDEVIIPEPFYANYNGFVNIAGAKVRPVTTTIENNFDLPDVEKFEQAISPKTKAILICNPSNPTGKLYTKKELEALRDLVKKHNLFLFVDEVYKEFAFDGQRFTSVLTFNDIADRVVVFDSISKKYSVCGARIGMLVSKNKEIIQGATKYAQARLSPPMIDQLGAMELVNLDDNYTKSVHARYDKRRKTLVKGLKGIPGVKVPEVKGAFYLVIELPVDDAEDFCRWLLTDFEDNNETLMLAPAEGFYATPGLGKSQVRIAYVLDQKKLKRTVELLQKALSTYTG